MLGICEEVALQKQALLSFALQDPVIYIPANINFTQKKCSTVVLGASSEQW